MTVAYPLRFQPEEEGGGYWVQGLPPLDNVLTQGPTLEVARERAAEALSLVLELLLDEGRPVPRPFSASGAGVYLIQPEPAVAARIAALGP